MPQLTPFPTNDIKYRGVKEFAQHVRANLAIAHNAIIEARVLSTHQDGGTPIPRRRLGVPLNGQLEPAQTTGAQVGPQIYSYGPVNESPRVNESVGTFLTQFSILSKDF